MHAMSADEFWKGEFGNDYQKRQKDSEVGSVESNMHFFTRILEHTFDVRTIIEFGAGTGQNIAALHKIDPDLKLTSVEINEQAAVEIPQGHVYRTSMLDYRPGGTGFDLAFTKGCLIHVPPVDLPKAYDVLYHSSKRYILIAEYFSPDPVMIEYRGHKDKLWKRDFAGEMLDRFPDLEVVDYGFVSKRDEFPQDDLTFFLLRKQ
jgi:spore coat polysaccharide biosynthesis protein SpsF